MRYFILSLLCAFIVIGNVFADDRILVEQEDEPCCSAAPTESTELIEEELAAQALSGEDIYDISQIRYVPMSFYMAREDDGSPGSSGYDDFNDVFLTYINFNKQLNDIGVQVYCASSPVHLDNSAYLRPSRSGDNADWIAFRSNKNANTPNTWINDGWEGVSTSGYAGRNSVELGSLSYTLVLHELGHFFGLTHTFSTKGEGAELVSRDTSIGNALVAGDFLLDTEADPYDLNSSLHLGEDYTYANGVMTSNTTDISGDLYTPPFDNIMSYYYGKSGFIFTPDQIAWMNAACDTWYEGMFEFLDASAPVATAPTNVTVEYVYDGYIVSWTNGENAWTTQIETSDDNGATWRVEGGAHSDSSSYKIYYLEKGIDHLVRLKHFNSVDAYSTPVAITPDKLTYEVPSYIPEFTGGNGSAGIGIGLMEIEGTGFRNADNIKDSYRLYKEEDVGLAELEKGSTYTFSVDVRVLNGRIYGGQMLVWIDYNADGDFLDDTELVYKNDVGNFEFKKFNVEIPNTAAPGKTRMRARAMTYAVEESKAFISNSEIEDYVVEIVGDSLVLSTVPELLDIDIYPNPTSSVITITNANMKEIIVYNMAGSTVMRVIARSDREKLDFSSLNNGIYFISVDEKMTKIVKE